MDEPTAPEPTPAEPEAAEPAESEPVAAEPAEPEPVAVAPAPRRRFVVALAVVAALLLASTATLGVLYGQARNDLAARDRSLAAQAVERQRLETELAAATARRNEVEGKLASTEAKLLDPAGYELIKKCVTEQAAFERALQDALNRALADGGTFVRKGGSSYSYTTIMAGPGTEASMSCGKAEPYLK